MAFQLRRFLDELKRRKVYRVAVVYAAVAFVIWQAAEIAFPALNIPDWALTLVVVLTLVGFPIAVVLAWAFDITPEGVQRTAAANGAEAEVMWTSRTFRVAAAAVVIIAVVIAAWWSWARRTSSASGPSIDRIAVFPFAVRGGEELLYLHEGMVHLLSNAMDGAGELRTVDPHALLSGLSLREGDAPDPETAAEVAARYGAGLYVLGSVVGSAERMEMTASLYDATSGQRTTAEAVPGRETEIQEAVDELARGLVADLAGRPGDRLAGLAARMTRSVPALKAYLAGHRALQRGDMRGSIEAFERSLELDSAFVLARYEFAVAAAWEGYGVPARQAVVQAVRDSAALPARERRLLVGLDAFLRGDLRSAEDAYRRVLGEYPDEVEANYMLGETLFHLGPIHGQSMQLSRAPFERVLTVDPDHLFSLHHLANLALMRGEYAAADSLHQRALATDPERWFAVCLRTMKAMASGDPGLRTAVQSELETVETLGLFCSMMTATWIFQDPAGARWVIEVLTAPYRPAELRATGHTLLAYFEAARGRPSQVERELTEVDRLYPTGASHRAYLSLLPLAPSDRNLLEERLREVEAWDVGSLPTSTTPLMMPPVEVQPAIRLYLLAALSARLGRDSAALAYADRLEQLEWAVGGDLSATLVPGIRAAVAATHGDVEEALGLLETAPFRGHYEEVYSSPVISMAAERYLMAELLAAAGRSREALSWFASLGDLQPYEIAYVAPAHLRRAHIHERLGEPEAAAEHYARFVELWKDCDPELRLLVEDAEARLARLRGQTEE